MNLTWVGSGDVLPSKGSTIDLSGLLRMFSETQVGAAMGWEPWYKPYLCPLLPDTQAVPLSADQHCGSQLMVQVPSTS